MQIQIRLGTIPLYETLPHPSLGHSVTSVDLLTPVLPRRSRYLPAAGSSILSALNDSRLAVSLGWVVAVDGPGKIPEIGVEAATVVWLGQRSGCATARNLALGASHADWVTPLDADDTLDIDGLAAIAASLPTLDPSIGWIAANRLLFDGRHSAHWIPTDARLCPGDLARRWTAPFPFHPNTIIIRRSLALAVGGWPALMVNEDLGFILTVSEVAHGLLTTQVIQRYRVWPGQTTSTRGYAPDKERAFAIIAQVINAKRAMSGRATITSPAPGRAYGREPREDIQSEDLRHR